MLWLLVKARLRTFTPGPDGRPQAVLNVLAVPNKLAQRCWPDWLVENGYSGEWIGPAYDIAKARRILGWELAFNFEQAHAAVAVQ